MCPVADCLLQPRLGFETLCVQAQMQELTRQINQQTLAFQTKGFEVKDMSSGMTHDAGGSSTTAKLS